MSEHIKPARIRDETNVDGRRRITILDGYVDELVIGGVECERLRVGPVTAEWGTIGPAHIRAARIDVRAQYVWSTVTTPDRPKEGEEV